MSIVALFDPTTDLCFRSDITTEVVASLVEVIAVNTFIDVCIDVPLIDFCFFDAVKIVAQVMCLCSRLLLIVAFALFCPAVVAVYNL